MVSLTQRDAFILEIQKDSELRPLHAMLFGEVVNESIPGNTSRAKLFDALRTNDSIRFRQLLEDLERRKLSSDSDWIGDDCVVFLLLLGMKRFSAGEALAEQLLRFRGRTAQSQFQAINQTFEAIRRGEFAMEGEFAFIKCVYRKLAENWTPSDSDFGKLYYQITLPGFVDQLDPFLRLLAIRTFDLVIEYRTHSLEVGSWTEVLRKLQDEGRKLSLSQFLALLKHLRISVLIAIVAVIFSVFAAGRVWSLWSLTRSPMERTTPPESLSIRTENSDIRDAWTVLIGRHSQDTATSSTNDKQIIMIAETEPFIYPTYSFTAKGVVALVSNVTALCLVVRPGNGLTSFIPVEVSSRGNAFTAQIPPCERGDSLRFFVGTILQQTNSLDLVRASIRIRASP